MTHDKITINDIAKEANVSTATVSNYINHKIGLMSKPTYRKVKRVILKNHYVPSINAQQLKTKKAKMVAFSAADITDFFSVEMFKGITDELKKYEYSTFLLNSNGNSVEERKNLLSLDTNLLAGLIVQPLNNDLHFFNKAHHSDIPIIILDRESSEPNYTSIVTNNFYITRQACRYFKNFKNLDTVFLISNNNQDISTINQRTLGISHVYAEKDIKLINPGKSKTSLKNAYRSLKMQLNDHPNSLIFAIKERWLLEFLPRLMYDGFVGNNKKTEVTGFSDSNLVNIIYPKIKVIKQYPFIMGEKAGDALITKLNPNKIVKFKRIVVPALFDDFK